MDLEAVGAEAEIRRLKHNLIDYLLGQGRRGP